MIYNFIIIGGGIVGASTAWQLMSRYPDKKILLIEKEASVGLHQTGHNSGVIHAGVYYEPGSLKAQFCKQGLKDTIRFCQSNDINFNQCGKLLVAKNSNEIIRMKTLFERCQINGIEVQWIDAQKLESMEPNIQGLGAIFVKQTGIVDYTEVTFKMTELFKECGGNVRFNTEVIALTETSKNVEVEVNIKGIRDKIFGEYLISCSGLMADRVARMIGIKTNFQIIPYRGEYYQLTSKPNDFVKHLIYPIPNLELPFLGVHITKMIDGSITVGPNAVQGWKREGYGNFNLSYKDTLEMIKFGGFWKVTNDNFYFGIREMTNSFWKPGYLKRIQQYCPKLTLSDLGPYPAGIRAQAVMNDGTMASDFLFSESNRSLHVCNAPSPAATSSIPIGKYICDKAMLHLNE